jgi:TrmH family RNA methyltransferase
VDCKEIVSQSNTNIKWLKKLAQKKHRVQSKEFTVENLTTIYDALKSGYDFKNLFVTQAFIDRNKDKFEYLKKASKAYAWHLIDADINKFYSQLDTPSGITAVYKATEATLDKTKSVIYLNGVKDPGNMGNIMRSALAFDVKNVILDETCVNAYNAKVINATKDAIFKLNIIEDKQCEWLKSNTEGLPIYAADAHNGAAIADVKAKKPFCLVLGSETHGVSEDIIKMADKSIRIDIESHIDSLNVSAAAAILLHGLRGK